MNFALPDSLRICVKSRHRGLQQDRDSCRYYTLVPSDCAADVLALVNCPFMSMPFTRITLPA